MRDNATDGSGGFAMVKEGGINYKHVVINFKSQRGKDIRFKIEMYPDPYVRPIYPNIPVPPAGWIYPNQQQQYNQQQQPYTFNRF